MTQLDTYRDRRHRLLLISNGRGDQGLLSHALLAIDAVLDQRREAIFIPFASVTHSWFDYRDRVAAALSPIDVHIEALLDPPTAERTIANAEAIIVGGGNTFELLRTLREWDVVDAVRERVHAGVPYIGWSAGANLACPTIRTTNDMPIVDPGEFEALNLINFQINPHFVNGGAGLGETRRQRIAEFTRVNPDVAVMGLPDNTWLLMKDGRIHFGGSGGAARWFVEGAAVRDIRPGVLDLECPDGNVAGVQVRSHSK